MTLELLRLFYLGQPFALAIGLALAVAAFGGAVISRPVVPLLAYLAVYVVFAQSNYGSLDVFMANPVYARGSGQLFYPVLCWALLVMLFWAWLGRRFAHAPPAPPSPVQRWLWAWLLLLLLHLVAGLALGQKARDILDGNGFVQLAWMLPLVALMRWSGGGRATLDAVARLLVLAALAKALFGLGRWAFAGGDPANVYQNFGHLAFKLTYFDVCDSLICLLGAVVAAVMLFGPERARSDHGPAWRLVCALTLVLALACVVLSYRRTAWGGLVLVLPWLAWRLDRRWRWPLLTLALPAAVAVVVWVALRRLDLQAGGGLSAFFFDLLGSRIGPESTRMLELQLAWRAFLESPLLGLGAWGRYAYSHLIPWQVMAGGSFLHSGLLHLVMKAGLVGGVLLVGLLLAFATEVRRLGAVTDPAARALLLAAVCGLLFMLPDFLFGTPVPQLRTMQLIGLCLGLPGLVAAAVAASGASSVAAKPAR